jgi:hypothetical protein
MTAQTILGIDPGALRLPIVFLTSPRWKGVVDIPPGAEKKDLAAPEQSPAGRLEPISLHASATSTALRLASSPSPA